MKRILLPLILFMVILSLTSVVKIKAVTDDFRSLQKQDASLMLRQDQSSPEFIEQALTTIEENASEIDFTESTTVASSSSNSNFTYIGESKYFLGINLEFISFTLRSVSDNVEVWVADDLSYGYDYPYTPDYVTQEQVDMLRDEFDNNIYPTTTSFFGNEDFHDGTNSLLDLYGNVPDGYYANPDGKKIILVENIKDESYYHDVPFYVSGFYWGLIERYIDRNIITIDSYAWWALMPNDNPRWEPYQYDVFGTVAHEFQHLIHADNDPAEETWLNEGMSDFSQYLCGYGHNWGHISWFLAYPENSLLVWGDYNGAELLADYGQAYLLQLYISEQFGQEFTRALATSPYQGIDSVNRVLNDFKIGIDFHELFKRFSIAVALDTNQIGNGIYNFESLDLRVDFESALIEDKDGIPAWGADYKVIDTTNKIEDIIFEGTEYLPMQWEVYYDEYLWGNTGSSVDNTLIFEADLSNLTAATLEFDHTYYIEESWDYGFVQVSLDNGLTWTTLANENTRDDFLNWGQYPNIGYQLPGFTGYCDYAHETFDLTPYVGQKIHIAFRYMTDGSYEEIGWFIDNITINEINYNNDCTSIDGFVDLDRLINNRINYSVVFINEIQLPNGKYEYKIVSVDLFNYSEEDALQLRQLFKEGTNYMITWFAPSNNTKVSVPFEYEIITKK